MDIELSALQEAPAVPRPGRKPTIAEDGVRAVLAEKKIRPIEHHEISYGAKIGEGAFGVVLKAECRSISCAIKRLHTGAARSVELLNNLVEEADVMAQLRHPCAGARSRSDGPQACLCFHVG